MTIVRAAVVQSASVGFDREATIERLRALTREAADQGARLVVFPEAFVGGYPRGLDFGTKVGSRSDAGRDWFLRYHEAAVDVPGKSCEAIAAAARENLVHLVVGVIERDGGTLYCAGLFFGPDGRLIHAHRKVMPTGAERLIWGFGDGRSLRVIETPVGRLGAAICWENYMPLLRMHLYSRGIQIYCAPTADARDTWQATIRHIACEGRCFVLASNQFARRSDYPADYPIEPDTGPDAVLCRGGSAIIDPLGRVLAGPLLDEPGILVADLDLAEIVRGKFDFDVTGHYARPDLFRLAVNDHATSHMEHAAPAESIIDDKEKEERED